MKRENTDTFFAQIIEPGNNPEPTDYLKDLLEKHRINPNEPPPPPPYCMWVNDKPIATYNGISVVSGKAKSRKSFLLTLLIAAYLKGEIGMIMTEVPDDKKKVCLFDTEQGEFRTFKAYERIKKISGGDVSENLEVFEIRTLDFKTRLQLIELAIYDCDGLGLLVIDGGRDLVSSINDEEQATEVVQKLLKWSGELGIHIILVLHENKGNDLLRGHFGTELMNKSELVYSVTKDQYSPDQSIIEYKASRDIEPEPFALGIDLEGLPYIVDNWTKATQNKTGKPRPIDFSTSEHFEIIRKVFHKQREFTRGEFTDVLKLAWGEKGNNFGDTISRTYVSFYFERGWVKKTGASNRTKYIIGDLDPGDHSDSSNNAFDVPF